MHPIGCVTCVDKPEETKYLFIGHPETAVENASNSKTRSPDK